MDAEAFRGLLDMGPLLGQVQQYVLWSAALLVVLVVARAWLRLPARKARRGIRGKGAHHSTRRITH